MNIQYLKQQLIEYGFQQTWVAKNTLESTYIFEIEEKSLEIIVNFILHEDKGYTARLSIQQKVEIISTFAKRIHLGEVTSMKQIKNLIVAIKTTLQNGEDL